MDEKINFVNLKYIIGELNVIHMGVDDHTPRCLVLAGVDGAYTRVSAVIHMGVGQCT
jgi:hypothetical protein